MTVIQCNDQNISSIENIIDTSYKFVYNSEESEELNVIKFTKSISLTQQTILDIYQQTKEQAESKVWFELRKGQITASKFHKVYTKVNSLQKSNEVETESLLLTSIERKTFHSLAKKHGIAMEIHALEAVKNEMKGNHKNMSFEKPGMTISETKLYYRQVLIFNEGAIVVEILL